MQEWDEIYMTASTTSPQISVIIPVYNVEKYLAKCLESVISQTFTDLEIIVIDDGSTDGSLAIAKEYEARDSRIHVYHQNNIGQGETRNRGIDLVAGKYLYFIDSDDFIDSDYLATLLQKAEETGADVVEGDMCMYRDDEDVSGTRLFHASCEGVHLNAENFRDFYARIVRAGYFSGGPCFRLVRTSFVKEHNVRFGDSRQMLAEDGFYSHQLMHFFPYVEFVSGPLYHYRQHASSTVHQAKKDLLKKQATMVAEYSRFIQSSPVHEVEKIICDSDAMSTFTLEVNNTLQTGGKYRDFRAAMADARKYPEFMAVICAYNRDRAYEYEQNRQHRALNRWISFCYAHHMDGAALRTVWILYRTMKSQEKFS